MATGRIGTTPVLTTRWSKAPSAGTTSLSGLDDNSVSLVYSVGYEAVYRNGVLLSRGNDYTATNGTSITLIDATLAGDIIEVFANQTIPLTDTYSQTVANGKFINNTLTTTTGDIIYASAANTPARLGIGSSSQVLTVSGGVPTWATPASGSLTQLATQTFSNTASHTFSSISSSYKFLFLKLVGVRSTTNEQPIRLRFNSDTGTNYKQGSWADLGKDSPTLTGISVLRDPDQGSTACLGSVWIYNYADTGNKAIFSLEASKSLLVYGQIGGWNNTAAITSITIYPASGNLEAGTATLFGGN